MRMCQRNGELEITDSKNAFVFVPHFDRFFNNCRPIDWTVLGKIKQKDMIEEPEPTKFLGTTSKINHKASKQQGTSTELCSA